MNQEAKQEWLRAINPANLRYLSALRGFVPSSFTADYSYAMLNCGDGNLLTALAASNPDANFYGFDGDSDKLTEAANLAAEYGVTNVRFVPADTATLVAAVAEGHLKSQFHYVVANLCTQNAEEVDSTLALAGSLLADGGLAYIAYPTETVGDINAALTSYTPNGGNTDKAHRAGSAAGLDYLGSAKLKNNYMELAAAPETHDTLLAQHGSAAYETLKDAAMGLKVRHDVWVKPGLTQGQGAAAFGSFSFSVTTPADYIDPQYKYFGKKLDFSTPLFTRLLSLLASMPHSIGDLLAQEELANANEADVVNGVQMLVAAGIAEPTRGGFRVGSGNFEHPHFSTTYNERLRDEQVHVDGALLAAPQIGRPVLGTAPMVMSLQALDQGGISGAEEILDQMLGQAPDDVKALIPADLNDAETRRNTAYRLLEQACKDWLAFCCIHGIMKPSEA